MLHISKEFVSSFNDQSDGWDYIVSSAYCDLILTLNSQNNSGWMEPVAQAIPSTFNKGNYISYAVHMSWLLDNDYIAMSDAAAGYILTAKGWLYLKTKELECTTGE